MKPRRREFSKDVRRDAYARSGGICECHRIPGMKACGRPLGPGDTFYEHIVQDRIGGPPTLDNCAVLVKTCWRWKTAVIDLPTVAKADRQFDRAIGIGRRNGPPMPGSRQSPFKHHIGKPWWNAWEKRA